MPIRLGQEFTAYAGSIDRGLRRVKEAADYLRDLGIGGSAVGTGVTVEKEYPALMVKNLATITGLDLRVGQDRIQLMQSMGDAAGFSAAMRVLAVDLSKIASDLRSWSWVRAPVSTRSSCRRCSLARRSCRGRSIHPSRRW